MFIHTSDIHIGECRTLDNYLERHKSVLEQIYKSALTHSCPLIIAGDIFHTRNTKHEERLLADWWFGEIERNKIKTIVIAGNHDHLWDEVTQLDGYVHMPFNYIKFVTWHPQAHIIGDIGFICISWGEHTKESFETIVRDKLPQIQHCKYKVVIAHECIVGSKLDNGLIMPKGTSLPNIPEIDYWAVGDIHKRQTTNLTNGHYSGAPLQFTFGDESLRGLLKVDIKNPTDPLFIPLKFKPMKIVSSIEEIKEDAYYMVRGNFEDVVQANKNEMVVKTEWNLSEKETIEYQKVGILEGLPEFLAAKSLDETYQLRAVDFVKKTLKLQVGE